MKTKIEKLIIVIVLLIFACCEKEESVNYLIVDDHKINSDRLKQAYSEAENITGIKSLLVSVNDSLIAEQYFTAMGANDLYDVRSVTKSVISTLIGIAIEEGFIESVDQTLLEFIGPLGYELEDEKASITIRDLLTMSAGFEWNEFADGYSYSDWIRSYDQIEYCINGALENSPGEVFSYSSEEAHLLSVIITEATGMSTHDFAFNYLFEPLGIGYEDFGWGVFPQGYFNGGADLSLKPRDMVKIGNLYLNNGIYEGKQIVPSAWIEEATKIQITTNDAIPYGPDYGYLWWINHDLTHDFFYANGYGGQFIIVVPDIELIVVATSEFQNLGETAGQQWYNVISLIVNDILNCIEY